MLKKEFKKSSFSSQVRFCVICRKNKDIVQVAHSKDPKISLSYSIYEWEAFVRGVKNGEFDVLDI